MLSVLNQPSAANEDQPRIERYAESDLPTTRGQFRVVVFREPSTGKEHVAMVYGDVRGGAPVPVRLHSECLTSEVLGSLRCDCRAQLDAALDDIVAAGRGVLLYLRQEGRGIGLGNKIRAYALQLGEGLDTVDANHRLGFPDDLRTYESAALMLRDLGVEAVELITNNPAKHRALLEAGIEVAARLPSMTAPTVHNVEYLRTKRDRSGHLLSISDDAP